MFTRNRLIAITILAALAALAGCGSDTPAITPADPTPQLPFPDSPDKLMLNFQTIYETMDYDAFGDLLGPDFVTILQYNTIYRFPELGPRLEVPEEQRIHERMFAGHPVTDPLGVVVPGVAGIEFQVLSPQGPWTTSPANDLIPDTRCRMYDVVILVDRGPLESALTVQGQIRFYVAARDSVVNGVTKPFYRMRGQLDLTAEGKSRAGQTKGVEATSWGTVKALFR